MLDRNIQNLVRRRREAAKAASVSDRLADRITAFTGSMRFVVLHLVLVTAWIVWNLGWLGLPAFDSSFVVLAMVASVEAIFLSTFVLISQNRMNGEAEARAELALQIDLLTEHELSRVIRVLVSIADSLAVDVDRAELIPLAADVQPEDVLDSIETAHGANPAGDTSV